MRRDTRSGDTRRSRPLSAQGNRKGSAEHDSPRPPSRVRPYVSRNPASARLLAATSLDSPESRGEPREAEVRAGAMRSTALGEGQKWSTPPRDDLRLEGESNGPSSLTPRSWKSARPAFVSRAVPADHGRASRTSDASRTTGLSPTTAKYQAAAAGDVGLCRAEPLRRPFRQIRITRRRAKTSTGQGGFLRPTRPVDLGVLPGRVSSGRGRHRSHHRRSHRRRRSRGHRRHRPCGLPAGGPR